MNGVLVPTECPKFIIFSEFWGPKETLLRLARMYWLWLCNWGRVRGEGRKREEGRGMREGRERDEGGMREGRERDEGGRGRDEGWMRDG
jgi:hypothetical protein